jgi:DNA-binding NtrC family response regulator
MKPTEEAIAGLLGESAAMRLVRQQIRTLGPLDTTVLMEGETGTGKDLVARALHQVSGRSNGPFVSLGVIGLAELLAATPSYGQASRVYGGAALVHERLFDDARGGTLLLDEVGDLPASMQVHLLHLLREREMLRLARASAQPPDVRVLAASRSGLDDQVTTGRFREDLFYRLREARIILPPLRQRRDDIPLLAASFVRRAAERYGKTVETIAPEAMARLTTYRWPGNVRELESTIALAVVHATDRAIGVDDLPPELAHDAVPPARAPMSAHERRRLVDMLKQTGGNRSMAARMLGISRATLYRRLAAMGGGSDATKKR